VGIPVRVSVEIDETDLEDYVKELMESSGRFKPAWVADYSDHAMFVEFGTNGAHFTKGTATYRSKNQISPVEESIRKWAEEKFGLKGHDRDYFAHNVYRKLMREGMPPQPFVRPAIYNVLQMVYADKDWFDKEDNSILKVAELIAMEMKRILDENGTPVSGDIKDQIQFFEDDGSRPYDMSPGLERLSPEVLNSLTADLNGDENRAADAKQRRRKRCS